jgi:hypothetical protein
MAGSVAWRRGDIPDDVLDAVRDAAGTSSQTFVLDLARRLHGAGYSVRQREVIPDRGDGREGRIDLVVTRADLTIVVECDRKTARRKSVIKLGRYPATGRLVVCREAA